MSLTNPTKPVGHRAPAWVAGPQLLFAAAIFTTFAVLAGAIALPADYIWPIASTLLLAMAAAAALIAWLRGRDFDRDRVSYWDVAGALTLVGIGASTLVDPDQLARIFQASHEQ